MTLQNDFADLIDSLETNLTTMGVSDAEFDSTTGIMGLVDKILDISPSIGGIDVVTSISCVLNKDNIYYNDDVIVSGVLEADKDDTSIANVDLEGYLKGATVKIYHNDTLVGTAITNGNGEYSFTYENVVIDGTNNVYAVFEGTDDYETCTSSSVNLTVMNHIDVFTDKNILSYNDNESATITAIPSLGAGQTVKLYNADTDALIGTMNDEGDGTYTYVYQSQGIGDINFVVKVGSSLQETFTIEDCYSTNWSGFIKSNYANVSVSATGQLEFSNNTSYYGGYIFDQKPNTPYMVELTYVHTSGGNFVFGLGFVNDNYTGTNTNYIANVYYGRTNWDYWGCLAGGKATAPVTGDVYRFEVYEDHIDTYKNDAFLRTCTPSVSPFTGRFAIIGTDTPRRQTWKNIKIKKL